MVGWIVGLVLGLCLFVPSPAVARDAPPTWTIVSSKYFTVLTTATPHEAELWASRLERFRVALGQMFPANVERLKPVVVVIFKNDRELRPFKMLQNGKPAGMAGFFSRAADVNAIGLGIDFSPRETSRIVFHEGTHWFQSTRDDPLPTWLEEGIAEVFSTFMADDERFVVGDSIREHVLFLRDQGLLPLAQLLGTDRAKLDYNETERTGRFYAESWLFAHWLMFGKDSPGPASIAHYLEQMQTTRDPEATFAAAFGGNYASVTKRLEKYMRDGTYVRSSYRLQVNELALIESARPATEAEIEYALGALALGGRGAEAALPRLLHAAQLDAKNVHVWELLGGLHLARHEEAAALDDYNRATALDSRAALAWHNRGVLREQAEMPSGDFVMTTDTSSFASYAADFRKAIELDPRCRDAYDALAGLASGVDPYDPADLLRFERGRQLFPDDPDIAFGSAVARLRGSEARRGTEELQALLARPSLPPRTRELALSALEGEKMKHLQALIESETKERRYAELIAALDDALKDDTLHPQNRETLRSMRRQASQMQRLDEAVDAYNNGHHEDAAKLIKAVLQDTPASWLIKREAERLLKAFEPGESPAG